MSNTKNDFFRTDAFMDTFKRITDTKLNFDRDELLRRHKANVETMTEANRLAVEILRSLTQLQTQYFKKAFDDMMQTFSNPVSNPMDPETHKKNLQNHSERIKSQFESATKHGKDIVSKMQESGKEMYSLFQESMKMNGLNGSSNAQKKDKSSKH